MSVIISLLLIAIGTGFLLWGADLFMDGVRDLSKTLGISALVLGIILAGLEPEEMLTAAIASGQDRGSIALGDVIGTNITITTLALGLSALLFPIAIDRVMRRQALTATLVSLPPMLLLLFVPVGRLVGFFLLLLFMGYTIFLLRQDRQAIEQLAENDDDDDDDGQRSNRVKPVLMTLAGLVVMVVGGPLIVYGATWLTKSTPLSGSVVGATIVSLATGAEMIVLGVTAARKRQADVLVGGILGSFAYNLLVTLGLAAVVRPLPGIDSALFQATLLMIAIHLVLLCLIWWGKIERWLGIVLVGVYVGYLLSGLLLY